MPKLNRLTLATALVAFATPALAQNVPTRTLSKPDAEYSEPFTQVTGVRELKDGRLIVIDPRDKTVQVVDMRLPRDWRTVVDLGFPAASLVVKHQLMTLG